MSSRNKNKDALILARLKGDFVSFLFVLWKALNLPQPTRCQIDMSKTLASGKQRRFILQAFRGIGKSFITCAFVVWKLWNNPQLKFMIVSASKERADANSIFIKRIIDLLPFLHELKPNAEQRDSVISFDVGLAKPDHSPSVKSVGITGQLTGSRADILIADDVEVPNNSATQTARERLGELVKEFDAILKPNGTIIYLGTPQTEMTLYRELESRGYVTTIWPARYPKDVRDRLSYGDRLAPMLVEEFDSDPDFYRWTPTDPIRFDDEDLRERELSYGKAGFALQFMLNPNLSDAEKYPLRLRDLIVAALDREKAPMTFQWLPNAQNQLQELPHVGLRGDAYHRYASCSNQFNTYTMKVMAIDPSGRGKDETGYAVGYLLNGYIFVMEVGGFRGGYDDVTLKKLANVAKKWKVNNVIVEGNFGDGMYLKLFSPILQSTYSCGLEEVKSKGQKEQRIADTLEPVLGSHRMVMNESAIMHDYQTAVNIDGTHDINYCCMYQLTRLTRERGALGHDDRLDALAILVAYFTECMEKDSQKGVEAAIEDFLMEHMDKPQLTGFDLMRQIDDGDISIQWEDDDSFGETMGNLMGW